MQVYMLVIMLALLLTLLLQFQSAYASDCQDWVKFPGTWKVPIYADEYQLEENDILASLASTPILDIPSEDFQTIVSQCKSNRYKFPVKNDDFIGTNHLEIFDTKPAAEYFKEPMFKSALRDDSLLYSLSKFIQKLVKPEMTIVDLFASWDSHLLDKMEFHSVIGIGIQKQEMQANAVLTEFHIQDLNENPRLAMIKNESIDLVLCSFSVQLMTRPFELLAEVHRILKPGGSFVLTFSPIIEDWKRVAKAWNFFKGSSSIHLYMVITYFQDSAAWNKLFISYQSKNSKILNENDDLIYIFQAIK